MPRPRHDGRPAHQPIFTRRARSARTRRRRLALAAVLAGVAILLIVLLSSGSGNGSASATGRPPVLRLRAGRVTLARIEAGRYLVGSRVQPARLSAAVARALPATGRVLDGRVERTFAYDVAATSARARRLGPGAGSVQVVRRLIAATVPAPVRRQQQANTCEAAALSILLATVGRVAGEQQIQQALPVSGTPDPQGTGTAEVWGDPDLGYVGRPDGGGSAGGFGVYPGPVIGVAQRLGVRLRDLSGRPASAVYASLLSGRAVMAWVGLSAGPIGTWTSPQGKQISVNFGEHTVVLHGIRPDGSVLVSNPLKGTREIWTPQTFQRMWGLLGDRAIST